MKGIFFKSVVIASVIIGISGVSSAQEIYQYRMPLSGVSSSGSSAPAFEPGNTDILELISLSNGQEGYYVGSYSGQEYAMATTDLGPGLWEDIINDCSSLGFGWYAPTIQEIQNTLLPIDDQALNDIGLRYGDYNAAYWSSTKGGGRNVYSFFRYQSVDNPQDFTGIRYDDESRYDTYLRCFYKI